MATNQMCEVLRHLRTAVLQRDTAGLTDGRLLEDYLGRRNEAALAALVLRHGPMVWGVCRRVLGDHHDAEDAFQATFLVLVRKAGSIATRDLVGNWLYGVAYQTAVNARAAAARRRARERQVTEMPEPETAAQELWHDLQPLLDQELSRLPEKYRAPVVLCELEGKTRKEAAQQLGCPEGTVAGRLARARAMLAKRLARHGLGMSGGALAAVLSQSAAPACVPPAVVSATINAATRLAAGQTAAGVVSVGVAGLTEGVLKTMFLKKLKGVLVTLALVVTGLVAASGVLLQTYAREPTNRAEEADLNETGAENAPSSILVVSAPYPGANARDVAETVAAPLEERIRGTRGLVRIESESTNDGAYCARLTFAPGTDLTAAEKVVKKRVALALAEPAFPEFVRKGGVTDRMTAAEVAEKLRESAKPALPESVRREGVLVKIGKASDNRKDVTIVVIDRADQGWKELDKAAAAVVKVLDPGRIATLQTFPHEEKQLACDVDRDRCRAYGVALEDLEKVLHSTVINKEPTIENIPIIQNKVIVQDVSTVRDLVVPTPTPACHINVRPAIGNKKPTIEELNNLVVKDPVCVRDVATIREIMAPAAVYRVNFHPAIRITVSPAKGESAVKVADKFMDLAKDVLRDAEGFMVENLSAK